MNLVLDVLKLRRVMLDYISPPICPMSFSGSGFILTSEDVLSPPPPDGVRLGGICDKFVLWNRDADLLGLSFYVSTDGGQTFSLLIEEMDANTVAVISPGWWKIAARTATGEVGLTAPVFSSGAGYIFLTIPDVAGATGFNLYKNPVQSDENQPFYLMASESSNGGFEINSSSSCFAVQAITDNGVSALSGTVCATHSSPGCFPTLQCPPLWYWDSDVLSCLPDDISAITGSPPYCCNGSAYLSLLTVVGGHPPFTWSITSGALPGGLSLAGGPFAGATTMISGTPTGAAGLFNFTVRATDNVLQYVEHSFSIRMMKFLSPSVLPGGTTDTAYDGTGYTLTADGGTPPYTFTLTAGSLPTGLSLTSGGLISGTGFLDGTSNFTIKVTDNNGLFCSQAFSIVIDPCPVVGSLPTIQYLASEVVGQTWTYAAFDPTRRLWCLPVKQFPVVPSQCLAVINTSANTADFATDPSNLMALHKDWLGNNSVFYDSVNDEIVVLVAFFFRFKWNNITGKLECIAVTPVPPNVPDGSTSYGRKLTPYNSANGHIYCVIGGSPYFDVTEYSMSTHLLVTEHRQVGAATGGFAAYIPSTNSVLVSNNSGASLYHKFNVGTNAFTVGVTPSGMPGGASGPAQSLFFLPDFKPAGSPNGTLVVGTGSNGWILFINPDTDTVIGSNHAGTRNFEDVVYDTCRNRIYAASSANGPLEYYDPASAYALTNVLLAAGYYNLLGEKDSGRLYANPVAPGVGSPVSVKTY